MPPDARAIQIDPWISPCELLHRRNLIRQSVVAHITEICVVEFFRAPRRPHTIDFDDDEPEFREPLRIAARGKKVSRPDASRLGPRIDVIDDRVLRRWVELGRLV